MAPPNPTVRMVHAATSRSREAVAGNEEAGAELRLGEFQDVDALTHSEAALVINAVVSKRKIDGRNLNETECVYLRWMGQAHSQLDMT